MICGVLGITSAPVALQLALMLAIVAVIFTAAYGWAVERIGLSALAWLLSAWRR